MRLVGANFESFVQYNEEITAEKPRTEWVGYKVLRLKEYQIQSQSKAKETAHNEKTNN